MRVLLLAENWPPRVGGIENYLSNMAYRLPKGSVTVVAPSASVTPGPENTPGRKTPDVGDPLTSGVKEARGVWGGPSVFRRRFFYPLIRPAWLPLYISLHRQLKREPANIILCGKALFEGQVGYYLKRSFGIPYVVFTYGLEIATWMQVPRLRRRLTRVLKTADRVVYINNITKQHLLTLGVAERQLVKIWPGVDERFFSVTPRASVTPGPPQHPMLRDPQHRVFPSPGFLDKYRLTQPYLLCVARLIPRKGIHLLIEAFSRLDQTKFGAYSLVIAGDGPHRSTLEQLAAHDYITPSVKFLGHVPDADLPALYAGATLFALTPVATSTDLEGFGIVYLEAAAAGLPAIATATGGASEAVVHGQTGLVVAPNVTAIHAALTTLLPDHDRLRQLGEAAKERAYNQFRWNKRILLVKGMIDAILAERILKQANEPS